MRDKDYFRQGLFKIFDDFVPAFRAVAVVIFFFVLIKAGFIKAFPFSVENVFIYCYLVHACH